MIIDTTHLKKFFKFTEGLFRGVDEFFITLRHRHDQITLLFIKVLAFMGIFNTVVGYRLYIHVRFT